MGNEWFMRTIRDYLIGAHEQFVFEQHRSVRLPRISRTNLYLHIPFCWSLCPYCPYNRILYDKATVKLYLNALLAEIETYRELSGKIEIGSLYIGGGTPTTMLDELEPIIDRIRQYFPVSGDIAIETIPSDLNEESLGKLKDIGVNLLSIGVQSFNDHYLHLIGRNYRSDILEPAISMALSTGFDAVNLDLMFALPGQSIDEALSDLNIAFDLGAEQVTLYPLFTFPYSAVGRHMRLQNVRFPRLITRRKMYKALHEYSIANGFNRTSVWGFKKGSIPRFSSVTRDHYIGIGAGSGSCLPGVFYFNTFSVPEYVRVNTGKTLPVALKMKMSQKVEDYYWFYWRLYDTYIPKDELKSRFGNDKKVNRMIIIAKKLGMMLDEKDQYVLTERGAFWIHLLQNYYVLNYIDKVWTRAMKEPWPQRVEL